MNKGEYDLYIVETSMKIANLVEFLENFCDGEEQIVSIVKDFYRDPNTKKYYETGRKICLIDNNLFIKLKKSKKSKEVMKIRKYELRYEHFSNGSTSTMHFYYPLSDKRNNNEIIRNKLECFCNFGILSNEDWFIHEKQGVCEFSPNVDDRTRAIIKLIVDSPTEFRVSWCRKKLFKTINPHFIFSDKIVKNNLS